MISKFFKNKKGDDLMTVEKLIEELQDYDSDAEVLICENEQYDLEITEIEQTDDGRVLIHD